MHSGKRLSEIVAAGPLPAARLLEIGAALAETIGAAHEAARMFGALGPATVFITDQGAVRLLDAADAPMSARREDDLLALGSILYCMATGTVPYPAPGAVSRLPGAPAAPRSPIELNPSLPSGLVQLISRAVHPEAGARFDSADEIIEALREVRRAPGSLESLLPAHHVSSSAAVKPPPRPVPGEDDDEGGLFDDEDGLIDPDDEGLRVDAGDEGGLVDPGAEGVLIEPDDESVSTAGDDQVGPTAGDDQVASTAGDDQVASTAGDDQVGLSGGDDEGARINGDREPDEAGGSRPKLWFSRWWRRGSG